MNDAVTYTAAYLAVLFLGPPRLRMLAGLPWLVLDCIGSLFIRERFGATLSAKAHDARMHKHPVWRGAADVIDAVFFLQDDHCRVQYERERAAGSVWAAWFADFKRG